MTRSVGAYEAKAHLSQLLDEVQAGNTVTITRHGVPVAVLAPSPDGRPRSVQTAIERLVGDRQGRPLGGISVRDLIDEGRR
jgi:prevent-host-death family protein